MNDTYQIEPKGVFGCLPVLRHELRYVELVTRNLSAQLEVCNTLLHVETANSIERRGSGGIKLYEKRCEKKNRKHLILLSTLIKSLKPISTKKNLGNTYLLSWLKN